MARRVESNGTETADVVGGVPVCVCACAVSSHALRHGGFQPRAHGAFVAGGDILDTHLLYICPLKKLFGDSNA